MIDDFAGVQHGFGKRGEFGAGKAANPGGHQPRGHLIIGNFVAGVGGNKVVDLFAGVFPGIPLFSDQVNGAHAIGGDCETNIGVVGRQSTRGAERVYSHRIPLASLKCLSEKRLKEMAARLGGGSGGASGSTGANHGRASVFKLELVDLADLTRISLGQGVTARVFPLSATT